MIETPEWLGSNDGNNSAGNLKICDILTVNSGTDATNGSITLSLGNASTGEVFTDNAILSNSSGIYSVPLPVGNINSDGSFSHASTSLVGAQAVCWVNNNFWTVLNVRDTRVQSNPGNIQAGEIAIQTLGAQGRILLKQDSSVNLYTTSDGTSSGDSCGIFVGTESIVISNTFGSITIDSNGITLTSGKASLTLSSSGDANLLGTTVNVQGSLASISGEIATCVGAGAMPVPGTNALGGIEGITGVPYLNVYLGQGG